MEEKKEVRHPEGEGSLSGQSAACETPRRQAEAGKVEYL